MHQRHLVTLIAATLINCSGSRADLEKFAIAYVASVYRSTDLYLQYTPPESVRVVEISRANMSDDFSIAGFDFTYPGTYEFGISFSNGASGVVTIVETDGKVRSASLIVEPPPTPSDTTDSDP